MPPIVITNAFKSSAIAASGLKGHARSSLLSQNDLAAREGVPLLRGKDGMDGATWFELVRGQWRIEEAL